MMHIDDHPDPEDLSLSLSLSLIPNPESCILILSFYNRLPSACRAGMQRDSDFRLQTADLSADLRLQTTSRPPTKSYDKSTFESRYCWPSGYSTILNH